MSLQKRSECTCMCHKNPGIKHIAACCHDEEDSDMLFSIKMDEKVSAPQINLVGQTEEDAIKMIEAAGMKYRVMKRDGESFMGTMDFDPMRFNLTVENGIVTEIRMN